ncbi:ankyrin repeat domain-containing protein [Thiorhodovibrio litoralis]|uniref:ankyrin repeat domain-containing protein n=1 Tax=Thiorhodovibrio litoralis TaxID=2952932 RepID=UPI001F5C8331|nr:ankyrin repeat domain-containing protein [Thiorhodovibrio litoralis]MBK5969472.1 hypothetical protein [Thiorhodovibrio winogradskyi]WPL11932.1 ankyrin-like protein [Thiorhodovibrio litoralis]
MLEQGTEINAQAHNGWTALMFAALVGKQDTVSALLASGADPGIKTKHGDTARSLVSSFMTVSTQRSVAQSNGLRGKSPARRSSANATP